MQREWSIIDLQQVSHATQPEILMNQIPMMRSGQQVALARTALGHKPHGAVLGADDTISGRL